MAFSPNPPGVYSLATVPFTAAMRQRLEQLGGIYNATDPDLSAFAANGGKLIIYHSWADQAIPPFASIDYYRAVVGQAGGLPAAQSFSRLYMIPGLYHCPCGQPVDGDPATTVQFMPQLVAWVEHGEAPGSITLPVTSQTTGTHVPLSTSILSIPCSRRRTTTGSTATTVHRRTKRLQARQRALVLRSRPGAGLLTALANGSGPSERWPSARPRAARSSPMMTKSLFQRYWPYFSPAAILAILFAAGAYIAATLPPRTIVMATGPEGGANYEFGRPLPRNPGKVRG